MPQSTPFFAAFGPLLFGRRRRKQIENLVAERASVSQYEEAFGDLIPRALLSVSGKAANSRERIFTPLVTFWAFLCQVLERGSSCRDAVRRVCAWIQFERPRQPAPSTDTSAYCQARARIEDGALERIGSHLCQRIERNVLDRHRWKGRVVKILDGTTVSMPDTAANQKRWPQGRSQKPGCGFPLMKLVGLFSLASGALLRVAHGSLRDSERVLARTLLDWIEKDEILLADRGFCSFFDLSALCRRGVDAVMRLHQARQADFRKGRRLGKDDRLIVWKKPSERTRSWSQQEFDALPQTLTVRMLRYRIAVPGFRSEQVILVTTLLDPQLYGIEELAELYFQRWSVELHFREIKTLLGMDVLRCLSPKLIVKEVAMHAIAYNLVRALMQRAALTFDVELERLSFKGTLDSLHHFADAIHAASGKPRKQASLLDALLATIAEDTIPLRPGRCEPRAKKRRPKNYHLLTKPRRKMRVPPHRNRPKSRLS